MRRIAPLPSQSPATPGRDGALLCNAVVLDDRGQLLPDGWAVFPAAAYTTAA